MICTWIDRWLRKPRPFISRDVDRGWIGGCNKLTMAQDEQFQLGQELCLGFIKLTVSHQIASSKMASQLCKLRAAMIRLRPSFK